MINFIKKNLTSDNVIRRIITTYICFLLVFITITIFSYYLLPEGLLRNKHPISNFQTSSTLIISSLQILAWNLISVMVILFANLFTWRKNKGDHFIPLGYLAFFTQITINAVILGTWSFSVANNAVPLLYRIIGTFDILKRAGIWEMTGQLLILCATINISLLITDGKDTTTKKWKTIKLTKQEILTFSIGLVLMLLGAIIESYAIINFI